LGKNWNKLIVSSISYKMTCRTKSDCKISFIFFILLIFFTVLSGINMALCQISYPFLRENRYSKKIFLIESFFFVSNRTNPLTWLLIFTVIVVSTSIILLFRIIMEENFGKIYPSSGMKKNWSILICYFVLNSWNLGY